VDPGEDFATAARRECEEEAGIRIELTGILRIEFMPSRPLRRREGSAGYCRMRVIYLGRPVDGQQLPKGKSDFESVGAAWATCEEVEKVLRLRGSEPRVWVPYVARTQGPLYPLSLLTVEGKLP
jgi:8-oxo-dGTP pyrophosphatase MutT (NUDIX family)